MCYFHILRADFHSNKFSFSLNRNYDTTQESVQDYRLLMNKHEAPQHSEYNWMVTQTMLSQNSDYC